MRSKAVVGCIAAIVPLAGGLTLFAVSGPVVFKTSPASGSSAPSSPPVTVCGNAGLLSGPSSAPSGG